MLLPLFYETKEFFWLGMYRFMLVASSIEFKNLFYLSIKK